MNWEYFIRFLLHKTSATVESQPNANLYGLVKELIPAKNRIFSQTGFRFHKRGVIFHVIRTGYFMRRQKHPHGH